MKALFICLGCTVILSSCHVSVKESLTDSTKTSTYKVPEDSAITKAVHDAYASISFKEGEKPRYAEIKNYFIPQAQLINFRLNTADVTNISQFVDPLYKGFIESNHVHLFYEEEIFGRTEQFGKIAHRISTYTTYLNTRDSIAERGVNSFQLIKTKDGWKVSSIIWDVEKPSLKVPEYYLPKK
ncbi:MAG TPA: hypothetical protein VGI43_08805 [Mucilaginibacter sp.]|jgi:hypothetical protein